MNADSTTTLPHRKTPFQTDFIQPHGSKSNIHTSENSDIATWSSTIMKVHGHATLGQKQTIYELSFRYDFIAFLCTCFICLFICFVFFWFFNFILFCSFLFFIFFVFFVFFVFLFFLFFLIFLFFLFFLIF